MAVDEARILQTWRGGAPPPPEALANLMLRRRVLTKALETRVVRLEVARRGLEIPAAEVSELMRAAAIGKGPRPLAGPPVEDLEARIFARFGAPVDRVERVARDLVESRVLTEALLEGVDDATLRSAWADAGTSVRLDLVGVSRVPTSREIDQAVDARAAEVASWYEAHRSRFVRPARTLVSRVYVAYGADRGAARERIEALRARVAGGEALEAVARSGSDGPNARRGGRIGALSQAQLPVAFEVEPRGGLTRVVPEREGWAFYQTEGRLPAQSRTLEDARIRREIAATLLREADDLPHARRTAERARALLRRAPDGEALRALVKTERLRRRTTEPFNRGAAKLVPSVGLAPKLFAAAFELEVGAVTPVFHVRQSYLVGRLVERTDAKLEEWPSERGAWTRAWRARSRQGAIERWLNERLGGEKLWVDMERLRALTLEDLGL